MLPGTLRRPKTPHHRLQQTRHLDDAIPPEAHLIPNINIR